MKGELLLWEEWFEDVEGEAEGLDGGGAGPHDDALDPQPDEGGERPEAGEDVGIVRTGLLYHAAQLSIAVSP